MALNSNFGGFVKFRHAVSGVDSATPTDVSLTTSNGNIDDTSGYILFDYGLNAGMLTLAVTPSTTTGGGTYVGSVYLLASDQGRPNTVSTLTLSSDIPLNKAIQPTGGSIVQISNVSAINLGSYTLTASVNTSAVENAFCNQAIYSSDIVLASDGDSIVNTTFNSAANNGGGTIGNIVMDGSGTSAPSTLDLSSVTNLTINVDNDYQVIGGITTYPLFSVSNATSSTGMSGTAGNGVITPPTGSCAVAVNLLNQNQFVSINWVYSVATDNTVYLTGTPTPVIVSSLSGLSPAQADILTHLLASLQRSAGIAQQEAVDILEARWTERYY